VKSDATQAEGLYQGIAGPSLSNASSGSPISSKVRPPCWEHGLLHIDLVRELREAMNPGDPHHAANGANGKVVETQGRRVSRSNLHS